MTFVMAKDFDAWFQRKKSLDSSDLVVFCNEREIWWCSLGANIGVEIDGKNENFERPILIVRKFNKNMFWALPITSKVHTSPFYQEIKGIHGPYWIALSQLRILSSKRLLRKIEQISESDFTDITENLRHLLP